MIRKIALMAGFAATLASTGIAHAGYNQTFNNFGGSFLINNFSGAPTHVGGSVFDNKFTVSLSNLNGTVGLQIPAPGTYGVTLNPGFSVGIDYDGNPGFDLGIIAPVATSLGTVTINSMGLPAGTPLNFNFTGNDSLNGIPFASIPNQHININGGGTSAFLGSLLGLPVPLTVSGSLGVDIDFDNGNNGMVVEIDDSALVGFDLDAFLFALDMKGNKDGKIDGSFLVNGSIHVPEPGSLALLGLGLAGLAAARRRASSQAA